MKNKLSIFVILCVFAFPAFSQVEMGKWRTHFAYNSVTKIAQTENKIYAVSDGVLFSVDKLDGNTEIYSKITGLNGTVISVLKYDEANKQLIIGYDNGNIDLLTNGGIVNIPDFYNKVMTVNKTINRIDIYDNKAYLSCNFGIIVLNLLKREIAETYYIGPNASEVNVVNTAVYGNEIYALTYTGTTNKAYRLYKASLNNSNLVNYENWNEVQNLPGSGTDFQDIASFAGTFFIQSDWKLYRLEQNNTWSLFSLPGNDAAMPGISVSRNKMMVANERNNVYIIDENLNIVHLQHVVQYAREGVYDPTNGTYWFAAGTEGAVSYNSNTNFREQFKPEGPAVNTPWNMTFAGEKLFVVPGGRWSAPNQNPGYVMIYERGSWSNISYSEIELQTGRRPVDFMNVAVDPFDDTRFFVTSFYTGLYEFRNNEFYKWYNYTNSTIEGLNATPNDMRLDGAVFDSKGNLFFANCYKLSPIKVLTKDNVWMQLDDYGFGVVPTWGRILISNKNENRKWMLAVRSTQGIAVVDDGGTLADMTDDRSVFLKSFDDMDNVGEKIVPIYYFSIAQDHNGVIWVGTDMGPLVFNNVDKVFETGYTCSRIKISRNDGSTQADYLLAEEEVKAIAIDGANRKWLGTANSGIYLMSENGQETIHHFTTDNSPLLSNEILSIAINPVTGEVFIGTGAGLVSYQSDAASAGNKFENVYAYPNPVRENFNGIITITGLVQNTQVKITDLNGNLICETVSNGSIATWDGKDAFGRKVSTGIYLALCVTEDGIDSIVTKILVIN